MRIPYHLVRSSSGYWSFRQRVPIDLQTVLGRKIIKHTLHTPKPFLFEDTEAVANAVRRYAHAVTGPHRARLRVFRAEAKLSEHDPSSNTQAAQRARRRVARAKMHVSPRIQAIQRWRLDKARQEMRQACEALEKNFKMELQEGIASTSAMTSNVEAGADQQSGHWELKFRRAKPSM
ncbi:plasmid mobilization protein [Pseudoxanthomonas winnipegensis]|nr:DUF6538 domain-containing protein [Pseudoxanthomonas winnipegensis]WJI17752.1 plasmid mobilization protein [Pseudoxanthomonas winnipegensis]